MLQKEINAFFDDVEQRFYGGNKYFTNRYKLEILKEAKSLYRNELKEFKKEFMQIQLKGFLNSVAVD